MEHHVVVCICGDNILNAESPDEFCSRECEQEFYEAQYGAYLSDMFSIPLTQKESFARRRVDRQQQMPRRHHLEGLS